MGQRFSVTFTAHTRECRTTEQYPRDCMVYPALATELLTQAILNGLFSFRGKTVTVTARMGEDQAITFVVHLQDNNTLTVQTILNHPFSYYDVFIRNRYRINLWKLVFPKKTIAQVKALCIRPKPKGRHVKLKKSHHHRVILNMEHETETQRLKRELREYKPTHHFKRGLD